ncbi:MAG: hypothetical protein GYA15_11150 [Leptolinea sp.]|jgi:hypothetical protein|nr:hypothetical protein [Leptolinea sp.]
MQRHAFSCDQPIRAVEILRDSRVLKSLELQVVGFIPLTRTDMQAAGNTLLRV